MVVPPGLSFEQGDVLNLIEDTSQPGRWQATYNDFAGEGKYDVAYIAMELIEGEDLKKYCEKAQLLPIETVLDYMTHVADGLATWH